MLGIGVRKSWAIIKIPFFEIFKYDHRNVVKVNIYLLLNICHTFLAY